MAASAVTVRVASSGVVWDPAPSAARATGLGRPRRSAGRPTAAVPVRTAPVSRSPGCTRRRAGTSSEGRARQTSMSWTSSMPRFKPRRLVTSRPVDRCISARTKENAMP
ncbi:hypothetical protein AQI96_26165 [Streptomyces canus]|nr:hypothetical protein AQI96_26165 [Streptomyces canus]